MPGSPAPRDVSLPVHAQPSAEAFLEDGELARDLARGHVALHVAAMGDFYRDALADQGHGETAEAITEAWQDDNREAAKAAMDDDPLDRVAPAGTPASDSGS